VEIRKPFFKKKPQYLLLARFYGYFLSILFSDGVESEKIREKKRKKKSNIRAYKLLWVFKWANIIILFSYFSNCVATEKRRRNKKRKKIIIKTRDYYSISSRLAVNFYYFPFFNFLKTQVSFVFWGEGWGVSI